MKRLALLAACGAFWFMFGAASPAAADNGPHVLGAGVVADGCASCHRTHTAKAGNLLKDTQPGLCYTCHGTTGTGAKTDVQSGLGYSAETRGASAGALRGGGFEFALIDSGFPTGQSDKTVIPNVSSAVSGVVPVKAVSSATTSSHSVDGTSTAAWGNGPISATANAGAAIKLSCGSCHDPHGNGNYRTLKPLPSESGATVAIPIADGATKVYTTTNYWKVEDQNAPGFILNASKWCSTCHTRYLATTTAGLPQDMSRVDSGDAIYQYRHTSDKTTQGARGCIQCHVSHGSNASMGTLSGSFGNPDGTPAPGNSKLLRIDNRGTCLMCHKK